MANTAKTTNEIDYSNEWYSGDQQKYLHRTVKHQHAARVKFIKEVISKFAPSAPKILDAGCGDGTITRILTTVPNSHVTGVDYNPLRVERAKKALPIATFVVGNALNLPFEKNQFDVVVSHHVVEHIKEDDAVISELFRVCKSGGVVIIGVPNEGAPLMKFRDKYIQPYIMKTTDHVNFYTYKTISAKVAKVKCAEILKIGVAGGALIPVSFLNTWAIRFKPVYSLFDFIAQKFPLLADSIFVVARKKD